MGKSYIGIRGTVDSPTAPTRRSVVDNAALVLTAILLGIAAVAILSTPAAPLEHPYPDAPSYVQLSERLASFDGYGVTIPKEPAGSRYPPGFPILLAMLSPVADATLATAILSIVFMAAVAWSAWKAGGPVASLVALVVISIGVSEHRFVGAVMSDLPAAGGLVLAFLAVQYGRPRLAGWIAGFTVWMRLAHVAIAAALPRRAWPGFVIALAGLAVTRLVWGWGYESGHAQWSLAHMWSTAELTSPGTATIGNLPYYAMLLLGVGEVMLVPPGAAIIAGWAIWRRPERRFVVPAVAGMLAMYLPYFYQDPRFLFGVAAFIAIYCGVGVADAVRRLQSGNLPDAHVGVDLDVGGPRRRVAEPVR